MSRLSKYLYKNTNCNKPLWGFCKKLSKLFYKLMKICESISGDKEIIEAKQKEIQTKVEEAAHVKKESEFLEHIVITKEEHIEKLYMFIRVLSVNFRNENYEEVDAMLKKLNL